MNTNPSRTTGAVSATLVLSLALIVSAAFNVYWVFSRDKQKEVLATVGREKLFVASLDPAYMQVLREAAEIWTENRVLSKEAAARSMTVEALLKKEVSDKAEVKKEDVYQRYVQSPTADHSPWPEVLKAIEEDLRNEHIRKNRTEFIKALSPKYFADIRVHAPPDAPVIDWSESRFPIYQVQRAVAEISAEGKVAGPPFQGPEDAPVVFEIYSDFMCPFSHKFSGTLQALRAKYPDKLRLVFRQFPLPMHAGAHPMAEASVCAQEQGKFWAYHDRLMTGDTAKKDNAALTLLAQELGLDVPKFKDCLDGGKYVSWVDNEIHLGDSRGASGTPSYFINGRMGVGATPSASLNKFVEWHLKPEGRYPVPPKPSQKPSGAGCGTPAGPALDPDRVYSFAAEWLKMGPSVGPEKAKATIVEFYDYHCPYCRQGSFTVAELLKRHPGQLQVIAKHSPLPMHSNAFKTAEGTMCADLQGKFWEYRTEVLGDFWGMNNPDDLKAIAKKIGLKEKEFNECLDTGKTKERVMTDIRIAKNIGVQGVPVYFINGRPVTGAQPIEKFEEALEKK